MKGSRIFRREKLVLLILIFQFKTSIYAIDIDISKKIVFIEDFDEFHSELEPKIDFILASDGTKLGYHSYIIDNPSWCFIFFHEGGANGKAWYTGFAYNLSQKFNASIFLFDIRGHGISEGESGDTPSEVQVWKDVSTAILFIKDKFRNIPVYLGGHSYGAGLVLRYIQWEKGEAPDLYILIAPQFGYKIDTDKVMDENYNFVTIDTKKLIVNSMLGSFAHTYAVHFNYPMHLVLEKKLVTQYTVDMCKALTPTDPEHIMCRLNRPMHILIAKNDEIIDYEKLMVFLDKMKKKNKNISYSLSENEGHFTVLSHAHTYLQEFFENLNQNEPKDY